ncbi:MAG: hypothetical protein FJ276_18750, partial [Planctomycetes bacterium]|nr:hypothetical protein [Planctomycetota bacterium]
MRIVATCLTTFVLVCSALAAEHRRTLCAESDPIVSAAASLDENMRILSEALRSKQPQDRQKAAETIGALRSKLGDSAWSVGTLLSDPRPAVRIAAIDALLNFDDPGFVRLYAQALADREPRVQCRAVIGIHELIRRHERLLPSAGVLEPADIPAWYEEAVRTVKRRSVRGLLAVACEQKSADVRFAIPIVAKCVGEGDHHLCGGLLYVLLEQSPSREFGRCLSDADASIRRGAARMLLELETVNPTARETLDAAEAITAALSDSDPIVRLYCVLTLTKHEDADPNRFTGLLGDADPTVRCAAVEALRRRRAKDAVAVLCQVAANDPTSRLRARAAFALASIAVSDPRLVERLTKRFSRQNTPRTRALLDMGLAYYWDEQDIEHAPHVNDVGPAIACIFKAIRQERSRPLPDDRNLLEGDRFDSTLLAAIGACGPAARQAVPQILHDMTQLTSLGSGDYRAGGENGRLESCLYALARIGPTPELIGALEDRHQVVRTMAAMALSEHRQFGARAVPVLVASLNGDCWGRCVFSHARRTDVNCLALFGHKAVPALLTLLRDNTHVALASEALSLMGMDADRVIPLLLPVLADDGESL